MRVTKLFDVHPITGVVLRVTEVVVQDQPPTALDEYIAAPQQRGARAFTPPRRPFRQSGQIRLVNCHFEAPHRQR